MAIERITSNDLLVIPQGSGGVVLKIPSIGSGGKWNEVQVDSSGRVVSGKFTSYLTQEYADNLISKALSSARASAQSAAAAVAAPSGIIVGWAGTIANIPSGWALCDGTLGTPNLLDRFILSVGALEEPGATGGSNTHTHAFTGTPGTTGATSAGTPTGLVSTPTFTGTPDNTGSTSAGTPSGTVSQPTLTMDPFTPVGTNASVSFTPTGTIAWPVGVPALTMDSYTPSGTNASIGFTPSGTIAWPAGVPTAANESAHTHSVTSNVSVDNHASHTHTYTEVPNHVHVQNTNNATTGATGAGVGAVVDASTSGGPTACWFSTQTNTGGVATGTTAGPSATLTHTVNNPAVTSGAGSAHTHVLSWPAGVPTFSGGADTVNGQTFTGNAAVLTGSIAWPVGVPTFAGSVDTVSAQTFTGTPTVPTGTISQPNFTGDAMATHLHSFTAVGTISTPVFTGDAMAAHDHSFTPVGTLDNANNIPVYFKLAWIQKL